MVLFESHIINATSINREYLPVAFNLYFQFATQVKPHHVEYEMQCLFVSA